MDPVRDRLVIDFSGIKPTCGQYREIPKEVFENCNQVTRNTYELGFLKLLRERARVITSEEINRFCQGNADLFTKKSEEFDWIYGLDALEEEFLRGKDSSTCLESLLTVQTVMRYNGLFSRYSNDKPGHFRERDICWAKHDLDIDELLLGCLFGGEIQERMDKPPAEVLASKNKVKIIVKESWVKRKIEELKRSPIQPIFPNKKTEDFVKANYHKFNPMQALSVWIQEQKETNKLDLIQWHKNRFHYFPLAKTLPQDLEKSLAELKDPKMHIVEKACKVWFDIVRIHISHEANKRTGKAIASIILLMHGFRPPIIDKENEKEYLNAFKEGFNEVNGHLRLTEFVVRLMKAQQS